MKFTAIRARALLSAAALTAVAGGVVATSVPASAALVHTQHVGVLYTNKIYHYADSFGQVRHWVVAQGRTIYAPWVNPSSWSDQGTSWAGISSYGADGRR